MSIQRSINKYLLNFRYAFHPRKPLLVARLAATFIRILFFNKRPLRYVDFAIGYSCNLKCRHCFATALKAQGRRELTPAEYKGIVRQAMKLGAVNFSFQGGEPTLYNSLIEFIRNSYPGKNLISVTTNGTLLNKEKMKELRRAGVDILTISLDSAIAGEHDRFRGVDGTFEKTMATIRTARSFGLNVTLGAVVSHENIKSRGLIDLIELAHALNIIIFLALAVPIGQWSNSTSVLLDDSDRLTLRALLKKYPLLRTDFEANYIMNGCGAVKEILYLTPYGDVLACPFLHFSLGNVFEETLESIRVRALTHNTFKRYDKRCLAAEDHDFMEQNAGGFYDKDGVVRRLPDIN